MERGVIVALLVIAASAIAADDPIGPDTWPSWRGQGDGVTTETGIELIDDAKQVKHVWQSAITNIPYTWPRHGGNGFTGHKICGGYGSPVVVSGQVYIAWWEPSGELIDSNAVARADDKRLDKWRSGADEILAAMDAATGETLWKTRMEGTGWNHQYNNHCAIYQPVAAEGVVCLHGNAGWVYCLETTDGKLRWKARLGKVTDAADAWKARGFTDDGPHRKRSEKKGLPRWNKYGMNVSPAIADGVVACNDQGGGLVGFDINSGEELWRVPNCSPTLGSPIVWTVEGAKPAKHYIISAGPPRVVCVAPKTGDVLWQINPPDKDADPLVEGEKLYPRKKGHKGWGKYGPPKIVADLGGTPALKGNILLLPGNRTKPHGGNVHVEPWHVGPSAWEISEAGAEMLWRKTRREFRVAHDSPVIYGDRAYITGVPVSLADGTVHRKESKKFYTTGTLISPFVGDGAIFSGGTMRKIHSDGGKSVKLPVRMDMYTHSFYADGFLFTRGPAEGFKVDVNQPNLPCRDAVHCYDLRK